MLAGDGEAVEKLYRAVCPLVSRIAAIKTAFEISRVNSKFQEGIIICKSTVLLLYGWPCNQKVVLKRKFFIREIEKGAEDDILH